MPVKAPHDAPPPPHWPERITYLTKPRLSASFPPALIPLLYDSKQASFPAQKFSPRPSPHPATVHIKPITTTAHPACGQFGLFTKKKISGGEMIIPYLGVIHHTLTPVSEGTNTDNDSTSAIRESGSESDYDLSLLRLSYADPRNPFPGSHISIGVDAAQMGNAARFVNDFRGIGTAPNAEFRVGRGEGGELRMEIWALKAGVGKGEEVLVSYGKSWWGSRK